MIDFLNSLNLTDKAISFYEKLYRKGSMTFNEIHSLKPELSKKELVELINELFQARLLIKTTPEDSSIIGHYIIIPPFFKIGEIINQISESFKGKENSKVKFENIIDDVFQNQNKVELENIYKDFKKLQDDINKDINTIKHELDELLDEIEKKEVKLGFLDKFELELKNIINSELASIVIILLQMKADFQKKLNTIGITDSQWNALKDEIKDTLASGIHEKSGELEDIVSEEFKEIKSQLNNQHMNILQDRFEQKSVYLGILNMFKTEIDKFHKALLLKKKNLNLDLIALEKSLINEIALVFEKLFKDSSHHIQQLKQFYKAFFEEYNEMFKSNFYTFYPIFSVAKTNEEISNFIKKSKNKLIMIVPMIADFIPIDTLKSKMEELSIELISSETHKNELVINITNKINIRYKRLKNNKSFIGIYSEDLGLILGTYQIEEKDPLKNIIGFYTKDKKSIELFLPLLLERLNEAKPQKVLQISNAFNYIIENINEIKGKEISNRLQNVLDITFKMKGISLDVLELKLLISRLKNVNSTLDNDWKTHIIEKIEEFNTKFTNLELIVPPELKTISTKVIQNEKELKPLSQTIKANYIEEANAMFELFFEKVNNLKGNEISNQIENMIEMIINFQGYSNLIEWKNNLRDIDEVPQKPFLEKLKEDLNGLREDLITQEEILEPETENENVSIKIKEMDYYSPALSEETESFEVSPTEVEEERNISDIYFKISQGLEILTGSEISEKLQQIMDITLETTGYSMALKDMRQWISRLRMIKNPLEGDIKVSLKEELEKWKEL